jgi:hypothetical protein
MLYTFHYICDQLTALVLPWYCLGIALATGSLDDNQKLESPDGCGTDDPSSAGWLK